MALATRCLVRTRATIAAPGTSVAAGTAVPDNCYTILFINRSGNLVLIGFGTAPAPLADNGTCTPLPGNATLTLPIGILAERCDLLADMIYDAVGGAANVDITYLCKLAGEP